MSFILKKASPEKLPEAPDMPMEWDHILDASPEPPYMWLCRERPPSSKTSSGDASIDDSWRPLRPRDRRLLNDAGGDTFPATEIPIDGGRLLADLSSLTARHAYLPAPPLDLRRAAWFLRPGGAGASPVPLSPADDAAVEELWRRGRGAGDAAGLADGRRKAATTVRHGKLCMVVRAEDFLSRMVTTEAVLQRGYGPYEVDGAREEDEVLGPTGHLVFVVHGIGEAMWSRDDSPVEDLRISVDGVRRAVHVRQVAHWEEEKKRTQNPDLPAPGKIEFLPVEWHHVLHEGGSEMMQTLERVTPQTIPALRTIANDVLLDVLLYMTPDYCQKVLAVVTDKISQLYQTFMKYNPHFAASTQQKCSIIGHSLGSVVAWDLLAARKHIEKTAGPTTWTAMARNGLFDLIDLTRGDDAPPEIRHSVSSDPWGPATSTPVERVLPFRPHVTVFLGSPVGLFLTLRGAQGAFDALRRREGAEASARGHHRRNDRECGDLDDDDEHDDGGVLPDDSAASSFVLPTGSLYNIYHPSDPVAYRIEPLLADLRCPKERLPAAVYVPCAGTARGKDGVKMHIKAKDAGGSLVKHLGNIFGKDKGGDREMGKGKGQMMGRRGGKSSEPAKMTFPLGGTEPRVDYQIQQGLVENQYMSAVMAHSGYFGNADVLDYIARILGSSDQREAELLAL